MVSARKTSKLILKERRKFEDVMGATDGPLAQNPKDSGRTDVYVEENNWTEPQKWCAVSSYLEGKALVWYRSVSRIERRNWSQLRTSMLREFTATNGDEYYGARILERRTKRGETMSDYAGAILALRNRFSEEVNEPRKIRYFMHWLHVALKERLIPEQGKLLADEIGRAKAHEFALSTEGLAQIGRVRAWHARGTEEPRTSFVGNMETNSTKQRLVRDQGSRSVTQAGSTVEWQYRETSVKTGGQEDAGATTSMLLMQRRWTQIM